MTVDLYQSIRTLPDALQPAAIIRQPGRTLLLVDPHASRVDVTAYVLDNMTAEEVDGYRTAHGLPPVGEPPDWEFLMGDGQCFLYVPPGLRLEGEQMLQGGDELARRIKSQAVGDETRAVAAELALLRQRRGVDSRKRTG